MRGCSAIAGGREGGSPTVARGEEAEGAEGPRQRRELAGGSVLERSRLAVLLAAGLELLPLRVL